MNFFCLHVCMCITCVPGTHRDQKGRQIPLDLDLEMSVGGHVSAGN